MALYLSERELFGEEFKRYMTARVPQCSTAGATLWNVLYDGDGVLNIQVKEGVTLVAYEDDLAVIIKARTEVQVQEKAKHTLELVEQWTMGN